MRNDEMDLNKTNDYFIKKNLQKYLIPTVMAILGTTIVSFINTILAGQSIGKEALAAMNLVNSFTFLFAMLGCLVNIGASACASVSIGRGEEQEVGEYETYAFLASIVLALITSGIILVFFHPFMLFLGADEALYTFMREYARIILIFGFLTTLMYFPFNFLRLDGRANLAMYVFLAMGIIDVVLLVGVLKAGKGLTGVALATVLSTAIADLLGVFLLFFGKNRQIRPGLLRFDRIGFLTVQVCRTGAAAGLNNLCNMLRTLALNALILRNIGTAAACEFAVSCSLISFASASVFGCGQTVAPLVGVFYGEHDPVSIKLLMKRTIQYALLIHGVLLVVLLLFAEPVVQLFGLKAPGTVSEAAMGIRFAAASLIPAAVMNVYIYYYTTVKENLIALTLTFLRAFGLVMLFSMLLFRIGMSKWYMAAFVLGELATFGCMYLFSSIRRKACPEKKGILLLEGQDPKKERLLSFSVPGDKDSAVGASERIEQFCEENEMDPKDSLMLPLALEELLVIISEHCLLGDSRQYSDVRILIYQDGVLLRIRCGGKLFDPMEWYHKKREEMSEEELLDDDILGIRLLDEAAKSINFKRTLGVNNLIVEI